MTNYANQSNIIVRGGSSTGDSFANCSDVLILSRSYTSPGTAPDDYGLHLLNCKNVRVFDCDFTLFARGIVADHTDIFNLSGNHFSRMRIDGIDIAQCWRGLIADNTFVAPDTGKPHPDAIQLWSKPDARPTSDIVIVHNHVDGMQTQGITAFNHVVNGVDDGGYDRITIADNYVRSGMPQGIALYAARNSVVMRNAVETMPGAQFRTSINIVGGTVTHCGNTAGPGAGKPGWADSPCAAS